MPCLPMESVVGRVKDAQWNTGWLATYFATRGVSNVKKEKLY
jgi:hypothetical protein